MAFECSEKAFIKVYRKFLEWEWYSDNNTKILFLHCLLKANWKACRWHGIEIEPGQFITSLPSLATETHLSIQEVRTALNHLKSTGEVTDYQQGKFRVITVNNWSCYQGDNRKSNRETTGKQQDANRMLTADKEYKEREEGKEVKEVKNIYGEYQHVRLTETEWDKLCNEYGNSDTHEAIKFLDEYIEMKGYKAKNHYLALRKWVFDAVKEDKAKRRPQGTNVFEDWAKA